MAKPLSLVAIARQTKPRKPLTWLDKLPAEHRKAVLELKEQWQANALGELTYKQLYEDIVKPNVPGIVSHKIFREWLNAK